ARGVARPPEHSPAAGPGPHGRGGDARRPAVLRHRAARYGRGGDRGPGGGAGDAGGGERVGVGEGRRAAARRLAHSGRQPAAAARPPVTRWQAAISAGRNCSGPATHTSWSPSTWKPTAPGIESRSRSWRWGATTWSRVEMITAVGRSMVDTQSRA